MIVFVYTIYSMYSFTIGGFGCQSVRSDLAHKNLCNLLAFWSNTKLHRYQTRIV